MRAIGRTKRCSHCRVEQPTSQFHKNRSQPDGLANACKLCMKQYQAEWHKSLGAFRVRNCWLKRAYGIDLLDYTKRMEAQGGKCLICSDKLDYKLVVDHDHSTGEVRGLICQRCNTGLGSFRDNPDFLQRAISYILKTLSSE